MERRARGLEGARQLGFEGVFLGLFVLLCAAAPRADVPGPGARGRCAPAPGKGGAKFWPGVQSPDHRGVAQPRPRQPSQLLSTGGSSSFLLPPASSAVTACCDGPAAACRECGAIACCLKRALVILSDARRERAKEDALPSPSPSPSVSRVAAARLAGSCCSPRRRSTACVQRVQRVQRGEVRLGFGQQQRQETQHNTNDKSRTQ